MFSHIWAYLSPCCISNYCLSKWSIHCDLSSWSALTNVVSTLAFIIAVYHSLLLLYPCCITLWVCSTVFPSFYLLRSNSPTSYQSYLWTNNRFYQVVCPTGLIMVQPDTHCSNLEQVLEAPAFQEYSQVWNVLFPEPKQTNLALCFLVSG